ncbi:MAG: lipid ABC transporter permease/ATP-binding protein, partial [Gammaproteobacteria bacterium]|nr:lipid ABC transporter permease/ATP-binding protein [Gammaproteobacteria bacterium]
MTNKRSRFPLFKDIRLYGRLLSYVMVYKWYFFLGLSLVVLFALTTPAVAVLMKPLLDGSFVQRDPDYILWTPIILIIIFAIRGIASYLHGVCMSWVLGYVVYDLQTQMIDRMI